MAKIKCFLVLSLLILEVLCVEDVNSAKNKVDGEKAISKRGAFHLGGGAIPATYASYFGYQNPLTSASVLNIPPTLKPSAILGSPTPYVLGHGGAAVSSYNVNYPRYPYYAIKPYSTFNLGLVNNVLIPNPIISPTPIIPPRPVIPQRPVLPISSIVPSNFFVPSQSFAPLPVVSNQPFANLPVIPTRPIAHFPSVIGTLPFTYPPNNFPITIPGSSVAASVPLGAPTAPIATFGSGQSWRPIIINQLPATSSPSIPRPAVSLLPPYQAAQSERGNIEDFQTANREYLVPNVQQNLVDQDFIREQEQQQQEQQQLLEHQQLHGTQESVDQSRTNQDKYFGVSSYEVPLEGNKGYSY